MSIFDAMRRVFNYCSTLFVICLIFFIAGCTAFVNNPQLPLVPSCNLPPDKLEQVAIEKQTPTKRQILNYTNSKDTKNPTKADNITASVEVYRFDDSSEKFIKNAECKDIDGAPISFEPSFNYMILYLTNNSNRIYNLSRTVMQIEDDHGNEYQIPSSLDKLVEATRSDIAKYYDNANTLYIQKVNAVQMERELDAQCAKVTEDDHAQVFGPYKEKFESYKSSHTLQTALEFINPFYWIALVLFQSTPHQDFDYSYAPERVWQGHLQDIRRSQKTSLQTINNRRSELVSTKSALAQSLKVACIEDFSKSLPQQDNKIIYTSGKFSDITILPAKTIKILIPFSHWKANSAPESLSLKIYDIVTMTDEASNPIKRSNLTFNFVRSVKDVVQK